MMKKIILWLLQDLLRGEKRISQKLKPHPFPGKRPPRISPFAYLSRQRDVEEFKSDSVDVAYEKFKRTPRKATQNKVYSFDR
jgi:hypothetical protein